MEVIAKVRTYISTKVLFREKVKRKDEESGEKDLKRRKEIIVFIQSIFL